MIDKYLYHRGNRKIAANISKLMWQLVHVINSAYELTADKIKRRESIKEVIWAKSRDIISLQYASKIMLTCEASSS